MKSTELTDIDGDALTITQRLDGTWITCTHGKAEVTVGPIPSDAIRNAFDQPMGGDDMDGGVTAALIEKETATVSPELLETALAAAIKDTGELTRERDEAREALRALGDAHRSLQGYTAELGKTTQYAALWKETARELLGARNGSRAALRHWQEKYDHPLTAADITDEMVERARDAWGRSCSNGPAVFRRVLVEALTAPTRPEGAEEIEQALSELDDLGGDVPAPTVTYAQRARLADLLADRGVRAPGGQQA